MYLSSSFFLWQILRLAIHIFYLGKFYITLFLYI